GPGCPLLRASDEHSFIVRVLRARRARGRSFPFLQARSFPLRGSAAWLILYCARRTTVIDLNDPSKLARTPFTRGGPIGLPLRASNEGLLRPRVARAQETNGPPPISTPRCSSPLRTLRSFHRILPGRFPNTRLFEPVCTDAEGRDG